jgi:hypothetical protein
LGELNANPEPGGCEWGIGGYYWNPIGRKKSSTSCASSTGDRFIVEVLFYSQAKLGDEKISGFRFSVFCFLLKSGCLFDIRMININNDKPFKRLNAG